MIHLPKGLLKRFSPHGMVIAYQARKGRKSYLMYVIDRALAANPQMSFSDLIDMALCTLFRDNPDCLRLLEADRIRLNPDFSAAVGATHEVMKSEIENLKTIEERT